MRSTHGHSMAYWLLGAAIKLFFIAFLGFIVLCLLSVLFLDIAVIATLFLQGFLFFAKGALTLLCLTAIVSLLEALR